MPQRCEQQNNCSFNKANNLICNSFSELKHHNNTDCQKYFTSNGQKRGFIQMGELSDFWIHMGTKCNLSCPSCFEGAGSQPNRIETLSYAEAKPIIFEALDLGVQKFSFTGGEPFIHNDFIKILDLALEYRPCLILTNATTPIEKHLPTLATLADKYNKLYIRVSIDYPNEQMHDKERGQGTFNKALTNCSKLAQMGHVISIARRKVDNENETEITAQFNKLFEQYSIPQDTNIIAFPNLLMSTDDNKNPEITEYCMTTYKTEQDRDNFMCCHCMMLTKKNGEFCFYPCTLVNDDDSYILGKTLSAARKSKKIILRHPRCFACFAHGTSCSEPTN